MMMHFYEEYYKVYDTKYASSKYVYTLTVLSEIPVHRAGELNTKFKKMYCAKVN